MTVTTLKRYGQLTAHVSYINRLAVLLRTEEISSEDAKKKATTACQTLIKDLKEG